MKIYNDMVKGFLRAEGRRIINEEGETVILRGWGMGNWMNPEGFMIGGTTPQGGGYAQPKKLDRARSLDQLLGWSVLSHGRVHIAISLLIVLILLFVDRSYLKIGTALCMLFGGPIIDGFSRLLQPLLQLCRRRPLRNLPS